MDPKFIVTSCRFTLCEDSFNEGEDIETLTEWTEDPRRGRYASVNDALEDVPYLHCSATPVDIKTAFLSDPCVEGDFSRFDADLTVDVVNGNDICSPTEQAVSDWKAGKRSLYALHISVRIMKVAQLDEVDCKGFTENS